MEYIKFFTSIQLNKLNRFYIHTSIRPRVAENRFLHHLAVHEALTEVQLVVPAMHLEGDTFTGSVAV